jgi:hypothetical protein
LANKGQKAIRWRRMKCTFKQKKTFFTSTTLSTCFTQSSGRAHPDGRSGPWHQHGLWQRNGLRQSLFEHRSLECSRNSRKGLNRLSNSISLRATFNWLVAVGRNCENIKEENSQVCQTILQFVFLPKIKRRKTKTVKSARHCCNF